MLKVKLLHPDAKAPTVAHPGSDLGFDLYALEDTQLRTGQPIKVRTGIAVEFDRSYMGALIRDRSSMAAKGIITSGGVLDCGYRGEIMVIMNLLTWQLSPTGGWPDEYFITAGDKIAQLVPVPCYTGGDILVVEELSASKRGEQGFGSTGI